MRTGINIHINRSKSVDIKAERELEVKSVPDKYCLLAITADGHTLNLFCTDEQLDQIEAAIQASKEARA